MTQGSPQSYADMLRERGPLDTFELVRVARSDRIATVTLNDPEHLNSYTLLASCIIGRSADFALLLSFTNIPVEAARLEAQRLHNLLLS